VASARILSWGYDSDVVRFFKITSSNKLRHHGESFAFALANARDDCPDRPIIFICHSLGGLVCEQALLCCRLSNAKRMRQVPGITKAIIFMGTPHSGSQLAKWGKTLSKYVNTIRRTNTGILDVLEPGSQVLVSLQKDFQQMLLSPEFHISVFCFYEEFAVTGVGKIVSDESAIMEQYPCASISANHMDMAKFRARNDSGYISVLRLLQSWIKELHTVATEKEANVSSSGKQISSKKSAHGFTQTIHSTVSGGQVYFGDVNHCGSGNINFHAGG
jgi:hypothetical protein